MLHEVVLRVISACEVHISEGGVTRGLFLRLFVAASFVAPFFVTIFFIVLRFKAAQENNAPREELLTVLDDVLLDCTARREGGRASPF